ncbi:hypothetical protein FWJ25_02085 [Marinobacter salinexigens]|uniref:DUF4175 domain-containing protein n=2 Tax=Marinobacter salinexigens TaxID=2919747 RepID=A0A5B0VRM0_9GAMM|nr:hypothetical protein FWJ25_02085 [Marinobacter salinexigens]
MMMDQEQMDRMHQNWSRMNHMMEDVPSTKSAQERRRLLEEHQEAMEEQMELMHRNMMGPGAGNSGMMGQGMMGGQADNNQRPGNGADMSSEERLQFMEERMNQMQLMMEQMLRHQQQLDKK